MVTYILLLKADAWGSLRMMEAGSETIKRQAEVLKEIGGEVLGYHAVVGQYDVVMTVRFPGDAEALFLSHIWNVAGLYPEGVLRAFGADEIDEARDVIQRLEPLIERMRMEIDAESAAQRRAAEPREEGG